MGTLRCDLHRDLVADRDRAAGGRGRAEGDGEAVASRLDDRPDSDAVDGAGDMVPLLRAPDLIGVERDGHQQLAAPGGGDHDGEALGLHGHEYTPFTAQP